MPVSHLQILHYTDFWYKWHLIDCGLAYETHHYSRVIAASIASQASKVQVATDVDFAHTASGLSTAETTVTAIVPSVTTGQVVKQFIVSVVNVTMTL